MTDDVNEFTTIEKDKLAEMQAENKRLKALVAGMADRLDDKCEWHYYHCYSLLGADEACTCGGDELFEKTRPYVSNKDGDHG
jgi:hypothetical protein